MKNEACKKCGAPCWKTTDALASTVKTVLNSGTWY